MNEMMSIKVGSMHWLLNISKESFSAVQGMVYKCMAFYSLHLEVIMRYFP